MGGSRPPVELVSSASRGPLIPRVVAYMHSARGFYPPRLPRQVRSQGKSRILHRILAHCLLHLFLRSRPLGLHCRPLFDPSPNLFRSLRTHLFQFCNTIPLRNILFLRPFHRSEEHTSELQSHFHL